ncbi:MAG: hypothetical protein IT577_23880 [Verrucomicrobiae bacterium]|nr:hypothetical protein [Verrucomicrobiae bacterium]
MAERIQISAGAPVAVMRRDGPNRRWRVLFRTASKKRKSRSCLTSDLQWAKWAAGAIIRASERGGPGAGAGAPDKSLRGGGRNRSSEGIHLTPLGRSLLLPPRVRRDCVRRAAAQLARARLSIGLGLALAADGHQAGARECLRMALGHMRAARGGLDVLFGEDRRHP